MKKRVAKKLIQNARAIAFTSVIFILLQYLNTSIGGLTVQKYVIWTVIGVGVLVLELFLSWVIASRKKETWIMPKLSSRSWREHFLNHALLPTGLFLISSLFIYENRGTAFTQLLILAVSLVYLPLFVNIHATYRNQLKVRNETHYVFDFVRIIIFYLGAVSIIDSGSFIGINILIQIALIALLVLFLLIPMIWLAKQIHYESIVLVVLTTLIITTFFFLINSFLSLNPLTLGLFITLGFFLALSYWHHKLEGSFDIHVFFEYALIVLIVVVILLGMS